MIRHERLEVNVIGERGQTVPVQLQVRVEGSEVEAVAKWRESIAGGGLQDFVTVCERVEEFLRSRYKAGRVEVEPVMLDLVGHDEEAA